AWLNVQVNVASLKDKSWAEPILEEGRKRVAEADRLCDEIVRLTEEKMA
ncbi:MAG: methenyltetrahydrofolate cyclohydrolase, partial [Bacteroidetes bacterium]